MSHLARLTALSVLVAVAALASARGAFIDSFLSTYKVKDDSKLGAKSCGICHVSDSDYAFNSYGRDVTKAMADKGATELDEAVLLAVEAADSDEDGTPNGAEIKAGTSPGDPAEGAAPGVTPKAAPKPAKKPHSFPPKNGFHPAIVHFPIALFIAGLLLDLLGMLRKDRGLLQAGWYTIVMAAVTTLGAILSGVLAMALLKLPYKGMIFDHILYAGGSTLIMWVLVAMRMDRHDKMHVGLRVAYYVLAALCFALISWAGHLGGVQVYGE